MNTQITRNGNVLTIVTSGIPNVLTFSFPEQAELYELVVQDKVHYKSTEFARSISMAKNPSANQMHWVNKLIANTNSFHANATTTYTSVNPKVDFSRVMKMFQNAKQHLKRPKITLLMPHIEADGTNTFSKDGKRVRFSLDKFGTKMNMYGSEWGINYGYIDVNTGEVNLRRQGRDNKEALMALLDEFCAEPRKLSILHGKLTGNCCYCSLPLSDPRSLHTGYGPVCADHWHFPWGDKPKFTPEGEWIGIKPVDADPIDESGQAEADEP